MPNPSKPPMTQWLRLVTSIAAVEVGAPHDYSETARLTIWALPTWACMCVQFNKIVNITTTKPTLVMKTTTTQIVNHNTKDLFRGWAFSMLLKSDNLC